MTFLKTCIVFFYQNICVSGRFHFQDQSLLTFTVAECILLINGKRVTDLRIYDKRPNLDTTLLVQLILC